MSDKTIPHAGKLLLMVAGITMLLGLPDANGRGKKNQNIQKPRQLFVNSGFEKGLAGWKPKRIRLIEDPTVAHSGTNCVLGEVRRRNTGTAIRRTLRLRSDHMYRLAVWAKADNHSRLTIWKITGNQRLVIANWPSVPRKWSRYRVNFTVDSDGPVTLLIVAPSSYWAPVGRMWLDDLSLLELPKWERLKVSDQNGFNDFPSMVKTGDDSVWVSWLSFRDGHDTLQVTRLTSANNKLERQRIREVAGIRNSRILDPTLVAGPTGAWLVYAAELNQNWDLFAVFLDDAKGPQEPIRITRHSGVDVHPSAVADGETLWIAWESNRDRGYRQIYLAALRAGTPGQPLCLSAPGTNNYQPSIVKRSSGPLQVAWHSFRNNNYDLFTRAISGGSPGPERRLTTAPAIDRGARLESWNDQVFLAWEHASYSGYKIGKASIKRVLVARLLDGRLRMPKGLKKTSLYSLAESPDLKLDQHGGLWIAARVPRDRNSGWDVVLWRYLQGKWATPRVLSTRKGMNRRPQLAVLEKLTAICYQGDDLPGRWQSIEESGKGSSGVYLSLVDNSPTPPGGRLRLVAFDPPRDLFEAGRLRVSRGEDRQGWTVSQRGKDLRLLFGDLHEHSDLSVCDRTHDESPDQTYQMMRDVARYDFGGLTDHGKCFNSYLWSHLGKLTRANSDPGRFLTLLGEEWSSSFEKPSKKYPYGYYGHRNMFFSNPFHQTWHNAAQPETPAQLWSRLRKGQIDFVTIPHQLADTGNVPVDWDFNDETAEPVAEIFQMRGSYECKGCPREAYRTMPTRGNFLQDAWARGIVIGVVAAPDHDGGSGKAAVYAKEFSRQSIFEALRARRTYGTTGAKILLDVRVNGLFMGEVGKPPGDEPVKVQVKVDGTAPIRKIEILRNNQIVFVARCHGNRLEFSFVDHPPQGSAFYYVRVTQRDNEMAWSSPVWLGRPAKPKDY
jgi:hypothetical protein